MSAKNHIILLFQTSTVFSMKVTVATMSDTVFTLEVTSDMEVENFKVTASFYTSNTPSLTGYWMSHNIFVDVEKFNFS